MAVLCAGLIIAARFLPPGSAFVLGGIAFAYTDALILIASGIGGMGCGMLTFTLPELAIHSGDEIENLYHSLQKPVGDMHGYIDRLLEEERKSAHMTKGFMAALAQVADAMLAMIDADRDYQMHE